MNITSLHGQESFYWVDWQRNQNVAGLAEKSTEKVNGNFKEKAFENKSFDKHELTDAQLKEVDELRSRDEHVRKHEQAHLQAAGRWASSGATYSYKRGPDNKLYAVGGEVNIDISEEKTPEETIAKMQVVKRAALAPADPSAQDKKVAARATAIEQRARMEKSQEAAQELADKLENPNGSKTPEIGQGNSETKNNSFETKSFGSETKSFGSETKNKTGDNQLYTGYLNMIFSGRHINKKV